jgi:hypothetical protein
VRIVRRPLVIASSLVVLLLAGCVPSEPTFDPVTGEGLDAVAEHFESLSAADQLTALATIDTRTEREFWRLAGIDDALGGEKAADDVFGEVQRGLTAIVASAQSGDSAIIAPASYRDGYDDAGGMGSFTNMITGALGGQAGVAQTDGTDASATKDLGEGMKVTISSSGGEITVTITIDTQIKGIDVHSKTESVFNPCPDAQGRVHAEGSSTLSVSAPDGRGMGQEITVIDDMVVDDDANLASSQHSYDVGYATTTGEGPVDAISVSSGPDGVTVNDSMGKGGAALAKDAEMLGAFMASWIADALEKAAAQGWSDGRCITLDIQVSDGPNGLDPDTKVTAIASPVAKTDGQPAGGTVKATLKDNGSLTPENEKVKAVATFTYTAPSDKDDWGTVTFESRSKRGVGKASVFFDTRRNRSYSFTGGGGDLSFSGQTCDIGKPFTLTGSGLTLSFDARGFTGGAYTISGSAGGVAWSGGGEYDITLANKGGTMITDGQHTIQSPAGSFTQPGTMNFTLTAIPRCS